MTWTPMEGCFCSYCDPTCYVIFRFRNLSLLSLNPLELVGSYDTLELAQAAAIEHRAKAHREWFEKD
jgi:hypothetical protein